MSGARRVWGTMKWTTLGAISSALKKLTTVGNQVSIKCKHLLTSDLSWSAHISTLCSKARQQIGLLYRKFYRYSDVDTLKQLYVAFICPHLEYATAVWDPHLSKDKQELETVKCFTCRVCTKNWDDAYCDMLRTLNITPLSERRKLLKMCHLYKIVHGFVDFPKCTVTVQALH